MKNRALPLLLTIAASAAIPAAAHAATGFGLLPAAFASAISAPGRVACTAPSPAAGTVAMAASPFTKSAAILGGAPSQLDLIMRQQGSAGTSGFTTSPSIQPNALPAAADCSGSARFALPRPEIAAMAPGILQPLPERRAGPDDFLGSRRLPISHTSFDAQWARVSHESLPGRMVKGLALISGNSGMLARIEAVNAWANGRIRYAEDESLYHKADYWADARSTLRLRAGDCEDIAILKMQLLAAMGVPRDAMFLTIARDLARHADHALLVVHEGDKFWLLDNATNTLVDANQAIDYRPIMSFNEKGKWLHGY